MLRHYSVGTKQRGMEIRTMLSKTKSMTWLLLRIRLMLFPIVLHLKMRPTITRLGTIRGQNSRRNSEMQRHYWVGATPHGTEIGRRLSKTKSMTWLLFRIRSMVSLIVLPLKMRPTRTRLGTIRGQNSRRNSEMQR